MCAFPVIKARCSPTSNVCLPASLSPAHSRFLQLFVAHFLIFCPNLCLISISIQRVPFPGKIFNLVFRRGVSIYKQRPHLFSSFSQSFLNPYPMYSRYIISISLKVYRVKFRHLPYVVFEDIQGSKIAQGGIGEYHSKLKSQPEKKVDPRLVKRCQKTLVSGKSCRKSLIHDQDILQL